MRAYISLLCGVLGLATTTLAMAADTTPLTERLAIGAGASF